MKWETVTVKNSKGDPVEGTILMPERLSDVLKLMEPERAFTLLLKDYKIRACRKVASGRMGKVTLKIQDLSPEQLDGLRKMGLISKY